MSDENLKQFSALMPNRLVLRDPHCQYIASNHPIAAALNDYAYDSVRKIVDRANKIGIKTLEIGGRFDEFLPDIHTCSLLKGSRDSARMLKQCYLAARTPEQIRRIEATQGIGKLVCTDGAQNCNYQAELGVAINSLYDVTFEQLIDIFINHGMIRLESWMYLPLSIIDKRFKSIEDKFCSISTRSRDGIEYYSFSILDHNNVYEHKASEWRKWLRYTKVETSAFDLVFEVEESYGPFCRYTITRCDHFRDVITRRLHFGELMSGFVLIPNMYLMAERNFAASRDEIADIVFPLEHYTDLINYACRQREGGYNWSSFSTMAASRQRKIVIGDVQFFGDLELDPITYHHAIFTLFIMGAVQRFKRTHFVSAAFDDLKQRGIVSGVLHDFGKELKRLFNFSDKHDKADNTRYSRVELDDELTSVVTNSLNTKSILSMDVSFFNNIDCNSIYRSERKGQKITRLVKIREDDVKADEEPEDDASTTASSNRTRTSSTSSSTDARASSLTRVTSISNLSTISAATLSASLSTITEDPESTDSSSFTTTTDDNLNSSQLSLTSQISGVTFKDKFGPGHCFLRTLHDTLCPDENIEQFYKDCDTIYADYRREYLRQYNTVSDSRISVRALDNAYVDYIELGMWNSIIMDHLPTIIAGAIGATMRIHFLNGTLIIGEGPTQIDMDLHDLHYTARGGSRGNPNRDLKYRNILSYCRGTVVDVSCAPGFFTNIARADKRTVLAYHYTGGDACTQTKEYEPYADLSTLSIKRKTGPHTHFIDIGKSKDTEDTYPLVVSYIGTNVGVGDTVIWKIFNEPEELERWGYRTRIERIDGSKKLSGERYAIIEWGIKGAITRNYTLECRTLRVTQSEVNELLTDYRSAGIDFIPYTELSGWRSWPIIVNYTADTGVAGSSKTGKFIEEAPDALYIVPTNELREAIIARGIAKNNVHTFHKALKRVSKYKTIVVDECFTLPIGYIAAIRILSNANIYLLGDIHQIPIIDFNKNFRKSRRLKDIIPNNNKVSHTLPQDVISIINKLYNTEYSTTSTVEKSIFVSDVTRKGLPCISFNRKATERCLGTKHITVHASQGSRFKDLQIYIDADATSTGMLDKEEHVYTSITRHTDSLVILGDREAYARSLAIDGTVLSIYSENAGVLFGDDVKYTRGQPAITTYHEEVRNNDQSYINIKEVETIYDRIFPPIHSVQHEIEGYNDYKFVGPEEGYAVIDKEHLIDKDASPVGYKVTLKKYAQQQSSSAPKEALGSLIQRYCKSTKRTGENKRLCRLMIESLTKFMFGSTNFKFLKDKLAAHSDEVVHHAFEYYESLDKKMRHGDQETLMASEELQSYKALFDAKLKYFNKAQMKFVPKATFDFRLLKDQDFIKSGQGISAWPKYLNVLYSGYFRYILSIVMQYRKGNHFIVTGKSEAEINDDMRPHHRVAEGYTYVENDYSGWDSHVTDFMVEFDAQLLEWAGCPKHLCDFYREFRKAYKLIYEGSSVRGWFKQQSGSPSTFCMNTLQNIALTNILIDFNDAVFSAWKGDDSLVQCRSYSWSPIARDILSKTDHDLKISSSPVGEFAGFIFTTEGMAPDIVRRVAKFISKCYRDEGHFIEAKKSVEQDLAVIRNQRHKQVAAYSLALHHKALGITPEEVLILFSFVERVKNMDFGKLIKVQLPRIPRPY